MPLPWLPVGKPGSTSPAGKPSLLPRWHAVAKVHKAHSKETACTELPLGPRPGERPWVGYLFWTLVQQHTSYPRCLHRCQWGHTWPPSQLNGSHFKFSVNLAKNLFCIRQEISLRCRYQEWKWLTVPVFSSSGYCTDRSEDNRVEQHTPSTLYYDIHIFLLPSLTVQPSLSDNDISFL